LRVEVEVEGWVQADTTVADADHIGHDVADGIARELPDMRSFNWTARGVYPRSIASPG
jgi:hypothetical protein